MTTTINAERYLRLSIAERSESLPKQLKAAMEDLKAVVPFDLEHFEAQKEKLIAELEAFQSEVTELRRIRAAPVRQGAESESLTSQEVREDLPGWLKECLKTCPTEREASILLQAHSALQLLQAQRHCDRSPERSASQPE